MQTIRKGTLFGIIPCSHSAEGRRVVVPFNQHQCRRFPCVTKTPRDNQMSEEKKCSSLAFSHTPVQSRCFPPPVFLPLLCSIWLVTLPLVLSTDSSLGSDSQSVENTRSRLKCSRRVEPYQMPGMSLMSQTGSETSTSCHTSALEICGQLPFHPSFYHPFTAYFSGARAFTSINWATGR